MQSKTASAFKKSSSAVYLHKGKIDQIIDIRLSDQRMKKRPTQDHSCHEKLDHWDFKDTNNMILPVHCYEVIKFETDHIDRRVDR